MEHAQAVQRASHTTSLDGTKPKKGQVGSLACQVRKLTTFFWPHLDLEAENHVTFGGVLEAAVGLGSHEDRLQLAGVQGLVDLRRRSSCESHRGVKGGDGSRES